ncbi:class I SAM-dependent DNA methyltransferase [Melaminivora jejuensis]|uniref:class I SAM-dependent DNA methyltransferase n=1 Tax=Melaminivora jejuensis TaxID=1267217 RepID=UPI001ADFEEC2|nr:class I SAM-dependent DNA methyltransferase [Melaminivora jejuensis]
MQWLEVLRNYRALDPACGSGNFLFLGLKALKDVELLTITAAADLGLDREQDLVTGVHNMLGIELNEYAAELARVSLWIGEIQWRIAHGYPPKTNPVLEPLEQIECRDALLAWPASPAAAAPVSPPHPHPLPQGAREPKADWSRRSWEPRSAALSAPAGPPAAPAGPAPARHPAASRALSDP